MASRFHAWAACLALLTGLFAPAASSQQVIDMKGKTAFVTGSTSGLGENVARRLGAMGATVIVHGLDAQRGQQIAAEITSQGPGRAVFLAGDLASLDEVGKLAARIRAEHPRVHLLINNAGIVGTAARRTSAEGHELTFAVNYLSHFHLTRELLPVLQAGAPARIVNVASIGQRPIDFDDPMMEKHYQPLNAYSQSKLAQILFTFSLSEMLDPASVTVNALHPATLMDTPMVEGMGLRPQATVEEGSNALMQLAVSTSLSGRSGLYFNQMSEGRANAQAYDPEARRRLWDMSLGLIENR